MTKTLKIRQAKAGDLEEILRLLAQLDAPGSPQAGLRRARGVFRRMERYPHYKVYVASAGGRPVGTFSLLVMDSLAHEGAPAAVVENVVVDQACRGRSIGRRMMAWALEECRRKGCYKLALSSQLRRADAHRFYESLGFRRHGYSFMIEPSEAKVSLP